MRSVGYWDCTSCERIAETLEGLQLYLAAIGCCLCVSVCYFCKYSDYGKRAERLDKENSRGNEDPLLPLEDISMNRTINTSSRTSNNEMKIPNKTWLSTTQCSRLCFPIQSRRTSCPFIASGLGLDEKSPLWGLNCRGRVYSTM